MNITMNKVVSIVLSLIGCSSVLADDMRLSITGSSTVAPLVLEIAKLYEKTHPAARINVQTGGSSRGVNDTRTGMADIGMVSRALKNSETDLTAYLIAVDGIGIVLHKSNPITQLSNREVVAIYTGEIRNWHELGGLDVPITVVNKAEGRSTLELFLQYFALKNSQIKAQVVIGDNQQGIKTISNNRGAIGYVSIGTAEYEEGRGVLIKRIPMAGQPATVEGVAKGSYPLSRQLNLVVKGPLTPLSRDFIAFAQSLEVHSLIEKQFFVVP